MGIFMTSKMFILLWNSLKMELFLTTLKERNAFQSQKPPKLLKREANLIII